MLLALLGAGAAFSCFWGLVTAAIPPAMAAVGIAVVNSFGALGAFITVSALGRLLEATHSYRPGVLLFSVAAVLAALAVQLVPRPTTAAGSGLGRVMAHGQHRAGRVAHHPLGGAAQQKVFQARETVRADDDQVGLFVLARW